MCFDLAISDAPYTRPFQVDSPHTVKGKLSRKDYSTPQNKLYARLYLITQDQLLHLLKVKSHIRTPSADPILTVEEDGGEFFLRQQLTAQELTQLMSSATDSLSFCSEAGAYTYLDYNCAVRIGGTLEDLPIYMITN